MLINCYYYAPHNHSMLWQHQEYDLDRIADMGCDILSVCVQEEQLVNWHQQRLRNLVEAAHARGLKVHAVPNRWCGLTAGWLDGFSAWSVRNPDTWIVNCNPDKYDVHIPDAASEPAHPKTCAQYEQSIKHTIDFGFDGLIWDEPRPECWEVVEFLDRMSGFARGLKPDLVVSYFAMSGEPDKAAHLEAVANDLARTAHIDYLGVDGHVRSQDHRMHRMKNTIFTAHRIFDPILRQAGKKTMYLLEGQRHRDEDLENYLANLDAAFGLPMDQLMFYYSAHEMSPANEERFNQATWNAVKRLANGR